MRLIAIFMLVVMAAVGLCIGAGVFAGMVGRLLHLGWKVGWYIVGAGS